MQIAEITHTLLGQNKARSLVAIAGPPASGKSTLAERLCDHINQNAACECAIVLPMDGFHLDNTILDHDNTRARKGASFTFDFDGFHHILKRTASAQQDVVIPTFDRTLDLSRAGARRITAAHSVILVEGNYLLLDEQPWQQLFDLFDYRIFLEVPEETLLQRLKQRWLDHGHSAEDALTRAQSNDLPNARQIIKYRLPADLNLPNQG